MRKGWLSLCLVLAIAACGAPEISDLENPTGTATPPPTGTGTGTPTGTPTATPSPIPSLTGVPSMATWETSIRPIQSARGCRNCHLGGTGGFTNDPIEMGTDLKEYYYFQNVCADTPGPRHVTYNPPSGRMFDLFCVNATTRNGTAHDTNAQAQLFTNADCIALDAWLREGTLAPPSCQ